MVTLSNLDFILIFAYFAILLIIGYLSSRKQKEESYLIANRKLGSLSTMFTLNASKTGSILMVFVAGVYLFGFAAIWFFIGATVGLLLFLPFALRLKENSKHKFYTLADYFKHNYGKTPAIFASLICILLMIGYTVINIIAGTKIFVFFTSWPFWLCAIIMVFVILVYLLMAGFKAVVKTDIIQYSAIVLILIFLVITLFKGSMIPVSEWGILNTNITALFAFFIAGILSPFAMPEIWQRVYASKNKKTLKIGFLTSAIVYLLVGLLLGLIALTIKVKFPGVDPDLALIHGFANLFPAGIVGLSIILLFSAIMSSLDTYIFTGASCIVQDFFKWDKKKTVKNLRIVILIIALIGILISIALQGLVISTFIFASFLLIMGLISISTWVKPKIKPRTLIFGFSIGLICLVSYLIYSIIQGEVNPLVAVVGVVGTLIGLIIGGIVSLFKS